MVGCCKGGLTLELACAVMLMRVAHDEGKRPPSLLELPSYLAGNVARVGHRVLSEALQKDDLRLGHYAVLTALSDFGQLAQHQLSRRLAVDRSHMVGYIDHLEAKGYLTRDRDPEDRRRQVVKLTAAGRRAQAKLAVSASRSQEQFLDCLSAAEQKQLIALLRRVLEAADERAQSA